MGSGRGGVSHPLTEEDEVWSCDLMHSLLQLAWAGPYESGGGGFPIPLTEENEVWSCDLMHSPQPGHMRGGDLFFGGGGGAFPSM